MMSMTPRLIPMGGGGGGGASSSSGSYAVNEAAGNINGFGAGAMPDFTINWTKTGNIVTLILAAGGTYTGTSSGTAFNITGLPAPISPIVGGVATHPFGVIDNAVGAMGRVSINSAGTMTLQRASVSGTDVVFSSTGFNAAGSKGLASTWSVIYPVS